MNRVWTALLLLATVVVAGAVGYVLVHNDPVPRAGQTPGYSAPAPSPSTTARPAATSSTSGSGSGSSSAPDPKTIKLAFLGDNWTKGDGIKHNAAKAFPDLITHELHLKTPVISASDGAGYAKHGSDGSAYSDLVAKVVAAKPDIVVVSGGRNDVSDDASTLASDAKNLFATLKSKLPSAKLVAISPFWGDSDHPNDLTKVDDAVKSGVQAAGGTYVAIADPLHNHPDWMADSANPNEQGQKAVANALKPELAKLL